MEGFSNAEWEHKANDVINISLVAPSKSGLKHIASFNPVYTHSIFGEEETLYGYKEPKVSLRFRANDMRPHLRVSYASKAKPIGDDEPTDIAGILEEGNHLPKVAFVRGTDFEDSSKQMSDSWTPPGTLHSTIDSPDGQYEVWTGTLADPAIKQLNSRVQIFIPLFIDGGSYIGQSPDNEQDFSDADRWTLFFLYQKRKLSDDSDKTSYVFVGYSTLYRFFYFQPPTPPPSPNSEWELPKGDFDLAELPCRTRLSQFIILPPFQGKGNGVRLYQTIFEHYYKHPQTHELSVEAPSSAFDDLRDVCDLAFLRNFPEFTGLKIDMDAQLPKSGPVPQLIIGGEKLEALRAKVKMSRRQFTRVVEMQLMSQLPKSVHPTTDPEFVQPTPTAADKNLLKRWQLIVKSRLYRDNKDLLAELEPAEKADALAKTVPNVEFEFARIVEALDRMNKHLEAAKKASNGKRKLDETDASEGSSKRARVEDA